MTQDQQQRPQIQPISSPPSYLTVEQYEETTTSTPESFADLPPRLILQLDGVSLQAGSSFVGLQAKEEKGSIWVTEQ